MKQISKSLLDDESIVGFVHLCQKSLENKKNKLEMVLRNRTESATHAQFKAIFGAWFDYLQDNERRSIDIIHREMKLKFLVRIYENEPVGNLQNMWAENIILWMERGAVEKALEARNRISLSWATKEQMCHYMYCIEMYYIEIDRPLPVIESKEKRKTYENFKKRMGLK